MGAQLDRITIEGYKSIGKVTVELRALNVLIGANGAGKSNFIAVFGFLRRIVEKQLQLTVQQAGGADRILRHGRKATPELFLGLHFARNGYSTKLVPTDDDNLVHAEEWAHFDGVYWGPTSRLLASGERESALTAAAEKNPKGVPAYVLPGMQSWRVFHFHDTSRSASVKQPCRIDDNVTLREDAANLAAVLHRMKQKHPTEYARVVAAVRQVAPFFEDFTLQPSRLRENDIKLEWKERGSEAYMDGHALSDGTLRFVCLVTMLYQPERPTVVVVDEPELGLHPYAIGFLANLFRSTTREFQIQIIAATQSTAFVNQLQPEEVLVVDRDESGSVFKRPTEKEIEQWLDGYGLGDLWEKNVLGGRPR